MITQECDSKRRIVSQIGHVSTWFADQVFLRVNLLILWHSDRRWTIFLFGWRFFWMRDTTRVGWSVYALHLNLLWVHRGYWISLRQACWGFYNSNQDTPLNYPLQRENRANSLTACSNSVRSPRRPLPGLLSRLSRSSGSSGSSASVETCFDCWISADHTQKASLNIHQTFPLLFLFLPNPEPNSSKLIASKETPRLAPRASTKDSRHDQVTRCNLASAHYIR